MTTTSPATIFPSVRASSAARSPSKTRAVPVKVESSNPADFTTAPSGASDPLRMVRPPVLWIGRSRLRMTSSSTAGGASASRFSRIVRPVTVRQSPCMRPASSSAFITIGMPPTLSTSFMTYLPKGLRSPRCGTLSPIRLKSSRVRSTSASRAMASRCRTALVEPPSAMTTVIAFSNASMVMIWRAVIPRRSISTTASPLRWANPSRRRSTAGGAAEPGRDMPSASATEAIVLAVYMPPQAPSPGQIARSIRSTSSRVILPARQAPTASKASMIVTSWPSTWPGMIEPA